MIERKEIITSTIILLLKFNAIHCALSNCNYVMINQSSGITYHPIDACTAGDDGGFFFSDKWICNNGRPELHYYSNGDCSGASDDSQTWTQYLGTYSTGNYECNHNTPCPYLSLQSYWMGINCTNGATYNHTRSVAAGGWQTQHFIIDQCAKSGITAVTSSINQCVSGGAASIATYPSEDCTGNPISNIIFSEPYDWICDGQLAYDVYLDCVDTFTTTAVPTTIAPTTVAPTTMQPTTISPTTILPTTVAPTTMRPTTVPPTTISPTTISPTTNGPTTIFPTTVAPTTVAPTTAEPTTMQPTTIFPTTFVPTTAVPTTFTPTTTFPTNNPTTVEPTTVAPTTTFPTTIEPTPLITTTMGVTTTAPTIQPTTRAPTGAHCNDDDGCGSGFYCKLPKGCSPTGLNGNIGSDLNCIGECKKEEEFCDSVDVSGGLISFIFNKGVKRNFDNLCELCLCTSIGNRLCTALKDVFEMFKNDYMFQAKFAAECNYNDYPDIADHGFGTVAPKQCSFDDVTVQCLVDVEECWCSALICKKNENYDEYCVRTEGNGANQFGIFFSVILVISIYLSM